MKRVLVVDDDPNVCKLLDFSLQRAGFSVIIANDGDEGLAQARQHKPDAVLLDIMMPSMHGYQLCRRLRAEPDLSEAVIIVMTARAQPVDREEAIRAGADLFLAKPVAPEQLVEQLQSLLKEREERARRPRQPPAPPVPGDLLAGMPSRAPARPVQEGGRVVACYSARAGVGVTTLAANLSLALAAWRRAPAGLVEVQTNQQDLLLAMGLQADANRGGLRAAGARLRWEEVSSQLLDHRAGVRVLPASPAGSSVPPALTRRAVALIRSRLALTVLDVGPEIDERAAPVLIDADLILLLTTPDVASIRALLDALEALRTLGYPTGQVRLVLNHVAQGAALTTEELEKGIGRSVLASIPFEPAVAEARAAHRALLTHDPRAPASRAIGRITLRIAQALRLSREGR
jgi:DNA-binding response OmpR family regulator/MinD-like ATPase involved in chromosome partitioning or flagellar assembly